jgi:DNA oxidative demethylase
MKTETDAARTVEMVRGFALHRGFLDRAAQVDLLESLRPVVAQAPFFRPITPGGRPMSVRMTSAGRLGWVTDARGYRYEPRHPSGVAWAPIPGPVLRLWQDITDLQRLPDCCLINHYAPEARMGLHQDRDEGNVDFPVVSISLGDDALFRMGGIDRTSGSESRWLCSGDVVVMGGPARLAFHGIDRLRPGTSDLVKGGGRINLTLRVVTSA